MRLTSLNPRLNLMFTIAAVATNVCALPVGTILDKYGPRVSGIIGSVCIAIGALLFAFSKELPFDGYIPGYLFLALGGPFVFISSFQLSNTFPHRSGLILSMLTGAFDSSSALFLLFRVLYNATNGSFDSQKFFLVYLVVPVFILIVQIFIMPKHSYKTVGELVKQAEDDINDTQSPDEEIGDDSRLAELREERRVRRESVISEITSLLGNKDNVKRAKREEKKNTHSGVWGAMHGQSALEQIKSPWFALITLFTVVQMTRINYFVATIRPQYTYLFNSKHQAKRINNIFDVALPLGGVVSIPFIGSILDNTTTTTTLATLVAVATIIGVLGMLPYFWAAVLNVCLFVIYRPFYYTAVSDYAAKVFGFQTFGKVYGLIICLAGILNFSQSALDALTLKVFDRDPRPVNGMLMVLALLVGSSLVVYVEWKSRALKRDRLEQEAEGTTESLMPNVGENGGYGT
jgi:MFS family permease